MDCDLGCGYQPSIFVVEPNRLFECPLCLKILNDPRQCANGHCFCFGCITIAFKNHQTCPVCKVSMNEFSMNKCLVVSGLIDNMQSFCTSRESCSDAPDSYSSNQVCPWVGELQKRSQHYETECEFFTIPCTNNGCEKIIERRQYAHHVNLECPFRLLTCSHCKSEDKFTINDLSAHLDTCVDVPVKCTNPGCEEQCPRSTLETHIQEHCMFTSVECPLAKHGMCDLCVGPQSRHAILNAHTGSPVVVLNTLDWALNSVCKKYTEKVEDIYGSIVKTYDVLSNSNAELAETNANLTEEVGRLSGRVNYLEAEMLALREFIQVATKQIAPSDSSKIGDKLAKAETQPLLNEPVDNFSKIGGANGTLLSSDNVQKGSIVTSKSAGKQSTAESASDKTAVDSPTAPSVSGATIPSSASLNQTSGNNSNASSVKNSSKSDSTELDTKKPRKYNTKQKKKLETLRELVYGVYTHATSGHANSFKIAAQYASDVLSELAYTGDSLFADRMDIVFGSGYEYSYSNAVQSAVFNCSDSDADDIEEFYEVCTRDIVTSHEIDTDKCIEILRTLSHTSNATMYLINLVRENSDIDPFRPKAGFTPHTALEIQRRRMLKIAPSGPVPGKTTRFAPYCLLVTGAGYDLANGVYFDSRGGTFTTKSIQAPDGQWVFFTISIIAFRPTPSSKAENIWDLSQCSFDPPSQQSAARKDSANGILHLYLISATSGENLPSSERPWACWSQSNAPAPTVSVKRITTNEVTDDDGIRIKECPSHTEIETIDGMYITMHRDRPQQRVQATATGTKNPSATALRAEKRG